MSTTTGAPLNIVIPARGESNWDDEMASALAAINNAVSAINTAVGNKADLVSGKVPTNQIPIVAINNVFPASSQAAMLALSASPGDEAIRSDNGNIYVLAASPASTLANWTQVNPPASGVTSWNGQSGIITGKPEFANAGTWALKQTFTTSPGVPTASLADAPVPLAQMTAAISSASSSSIPGRYTADFGDGSAKSFTFTHGRGTSSVGYWLQNLASGSPYAYEHPETVTATTTQITLTFVNAPAATNSLRLIVV